MSRKGSWGISKARPPTESRPGHVAIISGFPEDVAAVKRGWRENPVPFDSLFNQSRYTWSWGLPSIIQMFAKGYGKGNVFTKSYPAEMDEFYRDAYRFDEWVFQRFKVSIPQWLSLCIQGYNANRVGHWEFLNSTLRNDTLNSMVHRNKIVFFLHLPGIDEIGRPLTEMYDRALRKVDEGIEETYNIIEDYFADRRTAYVFTADHGMSDSGSHGAGSPEETLTPLITWGSGINQMLDTTTSACWPKSPLDVEQIDITPLMTALIGAPFPVNSIGVLPLEYLNISAEDKAHLMVANFKQLLEQVVVQKKRKREMYWSIFFRQFPDMTEQKITTLSDTLEYLLSKKHYASTIDICKQWIPTVLQAMRYYHQYERRLLTCCIIASYCAWLLCVFSILVGSKSLDLTLSRCSGFQLGVISAVLFLSWCNSFPLTFTFYAVMPFYVFCIADVRWIDLRRIWRLTGSVATLIAVVFVEMLAITFFYRHALIACMALMAVWVCSLRQCPYELRLCFVSLCVADCLFTLLPAVGQQLHHDLVLSFCFAWNFMTLLLISWKSYFSLFFVMQAASISAITYAPTAASQQEAAPAWVRFLCWALLVSSFVLPFMVSAIVIDKLTVIAFSLLVPFTLMSVSYEPLFLVTYTMHMYVWITIEAQLPPSWMAKLRFRQEGVACSRRAIVGAEDVRRALFFIFFLFLGFFGTGNLASLNNFDPRFTKLFVKDYCPFAVFFLLMIKVTIPWVIACCFLRTLAMFTNGTMETFYWLIVVVGDLLAAQFLLLLKDTGSWLEIGESICHYVIAMSMIAIVAPISYGARLYTGNKISPSKEYSP